MTKKTLNLSEPRLTQIAHFAEELNVTYSKVLGLAMAALREQYKMPHVLPGVKIKRLSASDGEAVAVKLGDEGEIVALSLDGARALAATIRDYVQDDKPRKTHYLNLDHDFRVKGVGRSVGVCLPAGATPWQATPDIAEELADLLEATASA